MRRSGFSAVPGAFAFSRDDSSCVCGTGARLSRSVVVQRLAPTTRTPSETERQRSVLRILIADHAPENALDQ